MSRTTALAVAPDTRPVTLAEFHNAWGWSPRIWGSLTVHHGFADDESRGSRSDSALRRLWRIIEELPEWQQAPLVLTFDTGIIPWQAYEWAVEQLTEFDAQLPAREGTVNHVPAMAELLRSRPETPWFGVWGTSVSENPFDPWDNEADEPGNGIAFTPGTVYVLERHREFFAPVVLLEETEK